SLYHGMQFIYKDLAMKNIRNSTLEQINAFYKSNYNGAFSPPERDINSIGYTYLNEGKKQQALRFFQLNVNNYPLSSNAFDSLAEAYMVLGDKENAIKNYKKSLELDGTNENAREMLQKLRQK
ncbi:MAG: tetratricopeptide repeat protein, partial [Nitrososphaeraceae archaeon]|nr:tetratricopeptide repeat protein [Nitrososphaeraceae archaeon]